ncbi:MAG: hypothetical protein KJO30_00980 [Boseongicola sp.]|nr:hypothetical protein [Boseongicola sp.]NNJ68103.1 hypothetical protein [Boseongicola sp.]
MSDHFLVVIPEDPKAEQPDTARALRAALAKLADTDEVRIKDYGKLQFIDCGEAFEGIGCPSCGAEISTEQWHQWMDEDWHGEDGFHLHRHETPCCQHDINLNALSYKPQQGFARWFVSARNEGRGPLTANELRALQEVAGIPLRAIAQMY